jgi:anti-sigma regulatory factor (Ser/Thr protein kinase)
MSPGDLVQKPRTRSAERGVKAREIRLRLSSGPDAVSAARRSLDPLEPHVGQQQLRDMRLLVSELVTNSVRHARRGDGDDVELAVTVWSDLIHVCVSDHGPGFEVGPVARRDDSPGGWGLFLVEQLSDRWGVELNGRTEVWFELER